MSLNSCPNNFLQNSMLIVSSFNKLSYYLYHMLRIWNNARHKVSNKDNNSIKSLFILCNLVFHPFCLEKVKIIYFLILLCFGNAKYFVEMSLNYVLTMFLKKLGFWFSIREKNIDSLPHNESWPQTYFWCLF